MSTNNKPLKKNNDVPKSHVKWDLKRNQMYMTTPQDPYWVNPQASTLLNLSWNQCYPRQHRKSFWQPGRYMWQLSVGTMSTRALMCAVYDLQQSIYWQLCNNSYFRRTWHKLTNYRLLLLQKTAKRCILSGENIVVRPGMTRHSHKLMGARYVALTITGESL